MVYLCLTPTICNFVDITPKMVYGRSQREQKKKFLGGGIGLGKKFSYTHNQALKRNQEQLSFVDFLILE